MKKEIKPIPNFEFDIERSKLKRQKTGLWIIIIGLCIIILILLIQIHKLNELNLEGVDLIIGMCDTINEQSDVANQCFAMVGIESRLSPMDCDTLRNLRGEME
jgi:hypothetical protein